MSGFLLGALNSGYSYANYYFTSPDAEVAYALVRTFKPKSLIEVGSGNSTQLFREAIEDGKLARNSFRSTHRLAKL